MLRVLHVLGGLGSGGTESLIMNWYRNIDRTKIQFDFLVRSDDSNYLDEITALGGRVFYTASFPRHFVQNRRETKKILQRKEWDIIHVHGNAAMYMLPLKLAKRLDYPCRIMHSHSVKAQNKLFDVIHSVNKKSISQYATHLFACSHAAGKWMFDREYELMKNAVNTEAFRFDPAARKSLRKEYGIGDRYVIGHVGRFATPKNHAFLLEIFREFRGSHPDSVLMLVGDGELEESIRNKGAELGILDSILFMGRRSDIGQLMSAMDMFVLPSLYEGLGIVLVEAQLNGLPCIVSDEAFNDEVAIIPHISRLSLNKDASAWAALMHEKSMLTQQRHISASFAQQSGYDMATEIKRLEEFYLHEAKG